MFITPQSSPSLPTPLHLALSFRLAIDNLGGVVEHLAAHNVGESLNLVLNGWMVRVCGIGLDQMVLLGVEARLGDLLACEFGAVGLAVSRGGVGCA